MPRADVGLVAVATVVTGYALPQLLQLHTLCRRVWIIADSARCCRGSRARDLPPFARWITTVAVRRTDYRGELVAGLRLPSSALHTLPLRCVIAPVSSTVLTPHALPVWIGLYRARGTRTRIAHELRRCPQFSWMPVLVATVWFKLLRVTVATGSARCRYAHQLVAVRAYHCRYAVGGRFHHVHTGQLLRLPYVTFAALYTAAAPHGSAVTTRLLRVTLTHTFD